MIKGLDYKAIGNYERVVMEEHPNQWAGGGFPKLNGFKNGVGSIDKLLDSGRCPLFRYDLSWSDKNHTYDSSFRAIVKDVAKSIRPVVDSHPQVRHIANPVTEHKLKEKEWLIYVDIVEQILGNSIEIVNVPLHGSGFVSNKYLNEYHGADKSPRGGRYAYSGDGTSFHDMIMRDVMSEFSEAEYLLGWIPQFNGNRKVGESDPRSQRIYYPTNKQFDALIFAMTNLGYSENFPKNCIGKSAGDQAKNHKTPQDKDCKPVFLAYLAANIRADHIVLKARNGQTVATSRARMSWDDESNHRQNGWRWYFNEWGMDISAKARRIQGDGLCDIFANGKKIGVWDPAFRAGKGR